MKKKPLLLVLVLTTLLLLLSSCSFLEQLGIYPGSTTTTVPTTTEDPTPKTAEELVGLVGMAMNELASYEKRETIDFTFFLEGIEIKAQTLTTEIVIDNEIDDYYYYNEEKSFIEAEALGINESSVSLDAYHNGYYFLLREEDDIVTQKLSTRISREKAIELQEKQAWENSENTDDFDPFSCTGKSFEKNADGTYTLALSGYTATAIDSFWESMNGTEDDIFDIQLLDLNITISVDNEYRIKQMKINFVFKESEDPEQTPSIEYTVSISAHNAAVKKTDKLILDNYPGANDLGIIYDAERLWNAHAEASAGSFSRIHRETINILGSVQTYEDESATGFYGTDSSGYYFTVDYADQGESKNQMEYSNGKLTVTQNGQTQTVLYTEKDAKTLISDLILAVEYDPDRVKSISRNKNTYLLAVHTTLEDEMEDLFASIGADLSSVSQSFSFTIEDDELTRVHISIVGEGMYQGAAMAYFITIDLNFYPFEQPNETISLTK